MKSQTIETINKNLRSRYKGKTYDKVKDLLEFEFLNDSTAYLRHFISFLIQILKEESKENNLKTF